MLIRRIFHESLENLPCEATSRVSKIFSRRQMKNPFLTKVAQCSEQPRFFLNLDQKIKNAEVQRAKIKRSDQETIKDQKIKKLEDQRSRKDQLRSKFQSSKINSDQRIKDQRPTQNSSDQKIKVQRSTQINEDQRIKTQIKMVSKFSKELCLILSF